MGNHARRRPKPLWRHRQGSVTGNWGSLTKQQERIAYRKKAKGHFPSLEQQEQLHRDMVARGGHQALRTSGNHG